MLNKVFKASSYLTVINGFSSATNFLLGIILIKTYSEDLRAQIIYLISISVILVTVFTFGKINGANYYIKKYGANKEIDNSLLKYIFACILISTIFLLSGIIDIDYNIVILFVVINQFIYLYLKPNFINQRKFSKLFFLNIMYPFSIILVLLLDEKNVNVINQIFLIELIFLVVFLYFYSKDLDKKNIKKSQKKVMNIYSRRSYISTLLNVLYHRFDIIILGFFIQSEEYSFYVVLKSILSIQLLFTNNINSLAYGFLLEVKNKEDLIKKFIFYNINLSFLCGVILVSSVIFFLDDYLSKDITILSHEIYMMCLGFGLYSISTPLTSYFNSTAKQKYNSISILISLLIYMLFILILNDPYISFLMSSLSILISRAVFYVICSYPRSKNSNNNFI